MALKNPVNATRQSRVCREPRRRLGIGGSSVENARVAGDVISSNLSQVPADRLVCILRLLRSGSEPRPNGAEEFKVAKPVLIRTRKQL